MPPGWILPEEVVAAVLEGGVGSWSVHYPEENWVYALETLCVIDQGQLAAAVQWMPSRNTGKTRQGNERVYQLQWAFGLPGREAALHALLEELANRLRRSKRGRLSTGRFTFGVGWLGIPTCWPHIIRGLQAAGFRAFRRWRIYTDASADRLKEMPFPNLPSRTRLDWQAEPANLEWELSIRNEESGESIGECQAWGIPTVFKPCQGYADWMTIEWLGVEGPYRQLGLARWLASEMIRRLREQGVQHFILWTEEDNLAARRVYESLGFQSYRETQEFELVFD